MLSAATQRADVGTNDPTYFVDAFGNGYFVDPRWDSPQSDEVGAAAGDPVARYSLSDTFLLHSNPGASKVVYLDFNGHVTTGTDWNTLWSMDPIVTPAWDLDGNRSAFSDSELQTIQNIWEIVAEDFFPFDVDVTTEDPGVEALRDTGGGDTQWGIRVVIGPDQANTGAGGIAYLDSFSWDSDTPCFAFNVWEVDVAEVASHEVGHTLGLSHDGTSTEEYYSGHGSGATGWAPIMGDGYSQQLVQWSNGEYPGANNQEDDLAMITTRNGFGYRTDDYGSSIASASPLVLTYSTPAFRQGLIERTTDADYFVFEIGAGVMSLNIDPFYRRPNLDILATLYDSTGAAIASSNPTDALNATFNVSLAEGRYYLSIDGAGKGPIPSDPGYSDYASLGRYTITGTLIPPNIATYPTSGLVTTESGGTATFSIVLANVAPTANVTVALSSSDASEGTVSPASVTFTPANWNVAQTMTVTGVDDFVDDGNAAYTIVTAAATSSDPIYNGVNAADVAVINYDDEVEAGITINPTAGLVTTELGGMATFTIVLNTRPTANVSVNLSSSDETEGWVWPGNVTFTPGNWNVPHAGKVIGLNDFTDDGDVAYTIVTAAATSNDPNYNGMNPADVSVTNNDDDVAGITVNPTSGLVTTESGATARFSIVLNTEPAADVTIALSSGDTSEGTVLPTSVTFTSANWNVSRTGTVTGVDDFVTDGPMAYTIVTAAATSSDPNYNGMNPADVSVANNDNDVAGITVNPTSVLVTTELRGTATFSIVLNTEPAADVTVAVSSSDTTEGTVSPGSVNFTPANWNVPRTLTVTGVDDFVDDGNVAYKIVTAAATSSDAGYNGMNAADVSVTNNDDDVAGITVNPSSGLATTESRGAATFSIVLNTEPTADVTIALSSSDASEGTVSPASVTFTAANWNVAETATMTGVDDFALDGDVAYTIVTAAATSTDPKYNGINAADVSVTNNDDEPSEVQVELPGDTGTNSVLVYRRGDNLLVVNRKKEIFNRPINSVKSLIILGVADKSDNVTVNFAAGGSFEIPEGIVFDGGTGIRAVDAIALRGTVGDDAFGVGTGAAAIGGLGVELREVEQLTLDGGVAGNDSYEVSDLSVKTTIVDRKGTDALDFSQASSGVTVDLGKNRGQAQKVFASSNFTLALKGTVENVTGSPLADVIKGNSAANVILGGGGDDWLYGRSGDDMLLGGDGDDWLYGDAGHDILFAGAGNNVLLGGAGNDLLDADIGVEAGLEGRNLLIGGAGADDLEGGLGEEILIGGTTRYDSTPAKLAAVMEVWKSQELSFQDRCQKLDAGFQDDAGAGWIQLRRKDKTNRKGTALDDKVRDTLFGGLGDDWFFSFPNDDADDL